jgi:hypothetical protein
MPKHWIAVTSLMPLAKKAAAVVKLVTNIADPALTYQRRKNEFSKAY